MAKWNKIKITLENGQETDAQAPIIVSVSRSTDIPAFYADWFFNRLEKGYSAWVNPFNGVKSYISYADTRFIVFWSKNPRPLLAHIDELKQRNIGCYIQFTLNDYANEGLEANVPNVDARINTFRQLVDELGLGHVIWRFDPLILTDTIDISTLLNKIVYIGDSLQGYTEKLVFSFVDIALYKKVKCNLDKSGIQYREWTEEMMEEFASKLSQTNKERGWNYQLATCAEKIDISKYGIAHNRCIDGDLITRLAWKDKALMKFMNVEIKEIPGLFGMDLLPEGAIALPENHYFVSKHKKDPGQRVLCECMAAKDIGEYNTCAHLCEYCYANSTKQLALENWKSHRANPYAETITGR